ncbi:hypothetical protein GCM10020331_089790 [Ectobacillus funiculus]
MADVIIREDELVELNKEADMYVQKLSGENHGDLSHVLAQLSALGDKEQREAGETLSALKRPVAAMMSGKHDEIPKKHCSPSVRLFQS